MAENLATIAEIHSAALVQTLRRLEQRIESLESEILKSRGQVRDSVILRIQAQAPTTPRKGEVVLYARGAVGVEAVYQKRPNGQETDLTA